MHSAGKLSVGGCFRRREALIFFCGLVLFFTSISLGQLGPEDVVILVNENSPTSKYIANLYREYYPEILDSQVLSLSGLTDCSGPSSTAADEIITRDQYTQLIAEPVRTYLADTNYPGRITETKVIITTAGMPYRIEDSNPAFANAIYPAGSNYNIISANVFDIDAASVESELTCLWYSDYGDNPFGLGNRAVNPYQGYRYSGLELFERTLPGTKTMLWNYAISFIETAPRMEGEQPMSWPLTYGTINRSFNAGDIYLTCRLDGSKQQGKSAVFDVREMLERARRASSDDYGVNPLQAVVVFDDAPTRGFDQNRVFNLDSSVNYWVYDPDVPQPPDAPGVLTRDDYVFGFTGMTNESVDYSDINIGFTDSPVDLCVILDRRSTTRTNQADLDALLDTYPQRDSDQGAILVASFGSNDDQGCPGTSSYVLDGGPGGGPLFELLNGAVFTSVESFNALTLFSGVNTVPVAQGKIVDFIEIGGTGAIGHSFEPMSDAIIDNEYLFYNLLADMDDDGRADLTFVEAAFTAIPYLSWSEVVIGDPLMQIAYGPGGKAWRPLYGDVDNDGRVNFADIMFVRMRIGGVLNTTNSVYFEKYDDLCDVDKDGRINFADIMFVRGNLGAVAGR